MASPGVREIEQKFEVPVDFDLPSFETSSEVTVLGDEEVELTADYYDTVDLRLARAGASLRHRNDEGWMVKLPNRASGHGLDRQEVGIDGVPDVIPSGAVDLVTALTRGQPLHRVATVQTHRHRLALGDADEHTVAEVADDRVVARTPNSEDRRFREIEVERRGEGRDETHHEIVDRLRAAGASGDRTVSKVQRVLGPEAGQPSELEAVSRHARTKTMRPLVQAAVAGSVQRLMTHDPIARMGDDPEGVHQTRVATRRLRSDLKTFRPVLERSVTDPLRDELHWIADELGAVRDIDVLERLVRRGAERLGWEDELVVERLVERLDRERVSARAALDTAMRSPRYIALLDRLIAVVEAPPVRSDRAKRRAKSEVPRLVKRSWRRVRKHVDGFGSDPADGDLHELRKRAKQARYAAEAVTGVVGKPAKRFAKAMEGMQDHLGDFQDRVVARQWLERAARESDDRRVASLASELAGLFACERQELRRTWPSRWRKARRKKLRRWL